MRIIKLASVVVALAVVAAGCGGSSSAGVSSPAATGQNGNPALPSVVIPAAGGGSCQVDISGDVTTSWHATQDLASLVVSYWLSASSRKEMSWTEGKEALTLICKGSGGSVMFSTTDKTLSADFPKSPKDYVIPAGGSYAAQPGQVSMQLNLSDHNIWKVTEAGSFKVTAFGSGKFAGTFSVKVGRSGDDPKTIVATAVVSGSFDFGCTGDACS
jgi:hypothetical protein